MHIPGRQVGPRPLALVFMFDLHGSLGPGRHRGVQAATGLDAGLLVGRDHKFILLQPLTLPLALIEVQNLSGFAREIRIAGKDPTAVLPRTNRLLMEPAPERRAATKPARQTSCRSSSRLQRESGMWWVAGSSHARALTCTTTSGGKRPGATRSGTFLQPGQALFEEAFAPLADDFPAGIQATSDVVVGEALRRVEDHLGTENLIIRQRILDRPAFEFPPLLRCEFDLEWADSRHIASIVQSGPYRKNNTLVY